MPLNHQFKTVFVHIPKCAGTSVTQMLDMTTFNNLSFCGSPGQYKNTHLKFKFKFPEEGYSKLVLRPPQHFTLNEIKKIIGNEIIENYFVFSIVRNPYTRFVSAYNKALKLVAGKPGYDSFDEFVDTIFNLPEDERVKTFQGHFETQSFYLKDENNSFDSLDKIYKFENLNECFAKINEIYPGVPILKQNSYPEVYDYKTHYNDATANLIYNFYREDFDNFNYSKSINI